MEARDHPVGLDFTGLCGSFKGRSLLPGAKTPRLRPFLEALSGFGVAPLAPLASRSPSSSFLPPPSISFALAWATSLWLLQLSSWVGGQPFFPHVGKMASAAHFLWHPSALPL